MLFSKDIFRNLPNNLDFTQHALTAMLTCFLSPPTGLTYVNGEADQPLPTNINFPPTPESPPMVADYTEGPTGGAPAVEVGSEGANTKSGEVAVTAAGGGSGLEAQVLFPSAPASHTEEGSTSPTVSAGKYLLNSKPPGPVFTNRIRLKLDPKNQLKFIIV